MPDEITNLKNQFLRKTIPKAFSKDTKRYIQSAT